MYGIFDAQMQVYLLQSGPAQNSVDSATMLTDHAVLFSANFTFFKYNNFEIFRVREPLVPVETMEKKQQVAAFAWEPAGDRFALVLGDVPKLEVTFYTMKVRVFDGPEGACHS